MALEERVLAAYYDRLTAFAIDKSRVITIEFQSADPELAARGANLIAEKYLSFQQVAKQDQARSAGQWLSGELEKLREQGVGGRGQGRGLPRQVQSVRRQQQHQPGRSAAHRVEQPGLRRPRAKGRRRGARPADPRGAPLRPGARFRPTSPIPS